MPENSSNLINKGFTLVEIIIVLIILGILAAVVLPNYVGNKERFTAGEGVQTLTTLLLSQKRYILEPENNNLYATDLASLDVTIPASPNFNTPWVSDASYPTKAASVTRNTGAYTLSINDAGTITCVGAICASIKTWK